VTWSDWGSPQRLLAAKKSLELRRQAPAPAIAPRPAARPRPRRPIGPQAELASR